MLVSPRGPGWQRPTELLPYQSNSHAVAEHGHLNGIAWVCYPKHIDADVRTSTIPWELLESQRLFGSQSGSL